MEVTKHDEGVPSWVDIGTDLEKGKAFYSGLLGWDCPEGEEATGFYSVASLKGKAVAGLGPQQEGMPSFWSTYVSVVDADVAAAKVKDAGGQVVLEPMDVMEFGRMAVFTDPVGAFFSVWQPQLHIGAEIVNEPGAYCWSELITTDIAGAKDFYGKVFGWGVIDSEGPMDYAEWKVGDRSVGGLMEKPDTMPAEVPPHWGVYFAVADIEASAAKVGELGGAVLMGPMATPAGSFVTAMDPVGATFNLIELDESGI